MASPQASPAPDASTFDSLTTWLESKMAELDVPGAAIGVVSGDQRFTRAMGVTEAGTTNAFTTSTPFGIASLSKIFTATASALLANDGLLDLDLPVQHYLSDFHLADTTAAATVTVQQLLSHAGGWADLVEPGPELDDPGWYTSVLADVPQVVPVGSHFSYCNSGYMLAGAIIGRLTGRTYADTIEQSLLQPIGMDHSAFTADSLQSTRATGHRVADHGLEPIPHEDIQPTVYPTAGVLSTVEDMLTFVQAHAGVEPALLDARALASMQQARNSGGSVGPIVVDNIGTGWMLLDIDGETVLMSQGGDGGLISAMVAIPARQFGMVVLANSDTAMMLCNDAVLRGMAQFTGLFRPELVPYEIDAEEAANADGEFGLPEWMTFTVTTSEASVQLAASAGGEQIPDLTGTLTMVSPTSGSMPAMGGTVWVDLVPGSNGTIQWLRFAGRMVPKIR